MVRVNFILVGGVVDAAEPHPLYSRVNFSVTIDWSERKVFFAPDANAMVIQLGAVCTGTVRVKEFLKKADEVIHGGNRHFQFNTVYSCKVRKMVQRTIEKKKAFRSVSVNSLTPICVPAGTKNYPSVDFLRRNSTFFLVSTTHKQHHHGELPPPPAARILQLDPIRRKPDADEGLGEGSVEAIQLNR